MVQSLLKTANLCYCVESIPIDWTPEQTACQQISSPIKSINDSFLLTVKVDTFNSKGSIVLAIEKVSIHKMIISYP